jgi:hypothetical protein
MMDTAEAIKQLRRCLPGVQLMVKILIRIRKLFNILIDIYAQAPIYRQLDSQIT